MSAATQAQSACATLSMNVQRALKAAEREHAPKAVELRRWARAALRDRDIEVAVRLVGEEEGRSLNQDYRGRDYATNVLTFTYGDDAEVEGLPLYGDIVLCVPVVVREAQEQGKAVAAHFAHLMVHGMLHLQGFDHESEAEAEIMEALETEILAGLGIDDPYA